MKKFLVVLLSLGLLVAFGATASALDVKFSGNYYVAGVYDNNQRLADENVKFARAFLYTRTRIQPIFQVAEGLTFTTRFDALEKVWGQTDWRTGFDDKNSSRRQVIATGGNPKIQENIEFERAYVAFATSLGVVQAGIMSSGKWGTDFGDDEQSRPRARIDTKMGPMQFGLVWEKEFDADQSSQAGYAGKVDADNDTLTMYGLYRFKGGDAGLLYKFFNRTAGRVSANNRARFHAFLPYVKATFGPVYFEVEAMYGFGKWNEYDGGVNAAVPPVATPDADFSNLGAYAKVQVNLGPAYFGGHGLWSQGNNLEDTTKFKTGPQSQDLAFALILGNDDLQTWNGSNGNGYVNGVGFDSGKGNSIMYGAFGGFNATPKLNIEATVVGAQRDTDALSRNAAGVITRAVSKNLGYEVDLTAKYKIYDNLTYMVGAGYLWTGDYFKGSNAAALVGNDYLLMNRLTLNF